MNRKGWAGTAALLGGVAVAYANSLSGSFQYDDFNVIVDNPSVHSLRAWLSGAAGGIRPLLKLSYALNRTVGTGPFGFHLVNTAVHAANVCLVYALSRRILPARNGTQADGIAPGPFIAALLFALHPIQTEAVTYVSGRSMSLMAFFYLASLLCYVRGVEENDRARIYFASPSLFLLALLTRETAATLPAALLLWETAAPGRRAVFRESARRQSVHWALLACAAAWFLLHPAYGKIWGARIVSGDMAGAAIAQVRGVSYLLSRLAMAHRLSIDPDIAVPGAWTLLTGAEGVLLLSLAAAGVAAWRRFPAVAFGILWFFLHLAPAYSFIRRLDVASERHLYLACWGIFLAVGAWAGTLRTAHWVPVAVLGGILLTVLTIARNHEYRSEVALWEKEVRLFPANPRARNNLGYAYQQAGRREDAIGCYREALRLDPGHRRARGNLAVLTGDAPQEGEY
ncbi:MAG: tetratricopeptide repeat protein [Thermodesulfobacteriota bacterium]